LYIVHIFDVSATFISTVSIAYARMEEAAYREHNARLLEFCVEHLGRDAQADAVEILIGQNSIASQGILEKAEKIKPSFILIGSKGSTAVREFLLGSTASALMDKSEYPVLTVPLNYRDTEFKTIVYATAFEEADIAAIQKITELAKVFKASLKLIHVSTKEEYAVEDQLQWFREMLREKVAYDDLEIELKFSEDIFKALTEYLDKIKPQLLAMLEREGHHLISNLWHRDLVKRMKLEVDIPLLSFHKKHLVYQKA
ncbi:MAG: universal stress protein, partial [Flavobacteriaceae bacterium]